MLLLLFRKQDFFCLCCRVLKRRGEMECRRVIFFFPLSRNSIIRRRFFLFQEGKWHVLNSGRKWERKLPAIFHWTDVVFAKKIPHWDRYSVTAEGEKESDFFCTSLGFKKKKPTHTRRSPSNSHIRKERKSYSRGQFMRLSLFSGETDYSSPIKIPPLFVRSRGSGTAAVFFFLGKNGIMKSLPPHILSFCPLRRGKCG